MLTLAKSSVYMLALQGKMASGKLTATERTKPNLTASLKMVERKFMRISPATSSSQNATYPK